MTLDKQADGLLRRARYLKMDFETSDLEAAVGAKTLLSDDKATVLMGR